MTQKRLRVKTPPRRALFVEAPAVVAVVAYYLVKQQIPLWVNSVCWYQEKT